MAVDYVDKKMAERSIPETEKALNELMRSLSGELPKTNTAKRSFSDDGLDRFIAKLQDTLAEACLLRKCRESISRVDLLENRHG